MQLGITALLFLVLLGCTPWISAYLEEVTGHAHQDEVFQQLGPPSSTEQLNDGGEVWTRLGI